VILDAPSQVDESFAFWAEYLDRLGLLTLGEEPQVLSHSR